MELFTSGFIFLATGILFTIFILGFPLFIKAPKNQPTNIRIVSSALSMGVFTIGTILIFLQAYQAGFVRPIPLFSSIFTTLAPALLICFLLQGLFVRSIRKPISQLRIWLLVSGLILWMLYARFGVGFNTEIENFNSNPLHNVGIKVGLYRNFLVLVLFSYFFYEIRETQSNTKDFLLSLLQVLCGLQIVLAVIWSAFLVIDHFSQIVFISGYDSLSTFDLNIRFARIGFFCISEVLLSIYWAQNYSLNALKERENKEKIQDLLLEKDILIEKLANSSTLIESGALSAGLAHELNQYLARIELNSDEALQIIRQPTTNHADLERPLTNILKANHLAAKLIISLRKLFNRVDETTSLCSIDDIVKDVVMLYTGRTLKSQIELKIELQAGGLQSIWEPLIRQVVVNLFSNAVDSLEASLQEDKFIEIHSRLNEQGYYCLEIVDNGPGMHKDQESKLFSLFASSKASGSGVGLWLSRYIVERHQGSLTYQNLPQGQGVKFVIAIPPSFH